MPDLAPIGTVTPEEQAKVIDALRTTEAREVLQDVIKSDSVDITDLPQTSILSGTSLPILEDGQLKVVPFAALANSIGSAIDTANDAAQQVADKIDEFEQAVEDAQSAVDAANAAATRATTAAEQAEAFGLEDSMGQSTTKAMTQKAVTDAIVPIAQQFETYDVEETGYIVGRLLPSGITSSYTAYRCLQFSAKKNDVIHYKAQADASTGIIGRKNGTSASHTIIVYGIGFSYVEGDYTVPEDGVYTVCGYNNKITTAVITTSGRVLKLEGKVSELGNEVQSFNEKFKAIDKKIGEYKQDENIRSFCTLIADYYIYTDGTLKSQGQYNILYLLVENATQIKVKGGFGGNTAIAFYSEYPFNASSLVEIHKFSDYPSGATYEEITLDVPSSAKYFAFTVGDQYLSSAYIKASAIEGDVSINTRLKALEKNTSAFTVDSTLNLMGITDNPLALIKETGGLTKGFESWGFIGDSIASGEIWGYLNDSKTLAPSLTDKKIDASGAIVDASGYVISAPIKGLTYRPKFVVEFASNSGLSDTMCVIARSDASGNIVTASKTTGGTSVKYELQLADNQYAVICYPADNIPTVRVVRFYVEDNYAISWGQYMARLCGSSGVNYSIGGGTAKKFVLDQSPFSSANSLAKLLSDDQKQGYIIGFGVNDQGNGMYDANVTDIENIAADVDYNDYTQNANTFAGYYARIIQQIKESFPDSYIFLVTIPDTGYDVANTIIRAMPTVFEGRLGSIYVLDLDAYMPKSVLNLFHMNGVHFNAQGYVYFAYVFSTYIDWLMRKYPSQFKRLSLVGKALLNNPT